jgi:2-iminobutanoate/2-iminopropanoate deaminase
LTANPLPSILPPHPNVEERTAMSKEYVKGDQQQARFYSKVVKTRGGTTLYLAGVGGSHDDDGNLLEFAGQTRRAFARLTENLEAAGGTLADMVTMTVFVTDVRFGDQFTQIRKEFFEDNYPGSALITVVGLARPEMLLEIQGIAVID